MIDPAQGTPIDPLMASMLRCRAAALALGELHEEYLAAEAVVKAAADRKATALNAYEQAWREHRKLVEGR